MHGMKLSYGQSPKNGKLGILDRLESRHESII